MKKALSLALSLVMVLSICATFGVAVSAEESVNLAAGKAVANQENIDASKTTMWIDTDLTDGVVETGDFASTIKWAAGQWFGYYSWAEATETNSVDGVAIPTVDFGTVCNIESARVHVYGGPGWSGVVPPTDVELLVSDDGENWTSAGAIEVTKAETDCSVWLEIKAAAGTTGKYARVAMTHSTEGSWLFIDELEVWGTEAASAPVVENKVINLLSESGELVLTNVDADDLAASIENGVLTASCLGTKWPHVDYNFTTPVTVPVEGTYVEIEATVTGGNGASIRLLGTTDDNDGDAATDDIYLHQFGGDYELDGGGDVPSGNNVTYKMLLSDMAFCNYDSAEGYAGKIDFTTDELTFAGVQVFVSGSGSTVTINKLNLIVPGTASVKTELKNVAEGKAYTTSDLFRMSNVTWGWDETFDVTYPDEGGISLTDGVKDPGDSDYTNAVWAGFNYSSPDYTENGYSWITVDLGEVTDISKVVLVSASSALGSGIGSNNFAIEFLVSDDGENWTSIGTCDAVDSTEVNLVETAVETSASGQYVQVRMSRGGWMFISEVEVYAEVEVETEDNLGDAGIYAIGALALVALIGTAVVIKKRA